MMIVISRLKNVHLIVRCVKMQLASTLIGVIALGMPISTLGKDCSNKEDAKPAVECLEKKIEQLTSKLKQLTSDDQNRVIASISVQDGRFVSGTEGSKYDGDTGIVTFNNPSNLPFIPVISDISSQEYITTTHFIKEIIGYNQFRVRQTPLDTTDRHSQPKGFTAIIIGYSKK